MFTGIVQGIGEIIAIREPSDDFRTHVVKLPDGMTEHLQIGASVANNGCRTKCASKFPESGVH